MGKRLDVLTQPIRVTWSKKPGRAKRAQEELLRQYNERLRTLHPGSMPPEVLAKLLKSLPGFKVIFQKEGGRPVRWGFMRLFFLWFDIQLVKGEKNCSEREACGVVFRTSNEYKDCERPTTLLRRLNEAKTSPMVEFSKSVIEDLGWPEWFAASEHFLDQKVRADILQHDIRP